MSITKVKEYTVEELAEIRENKELNKYIKEQYPEIFDEFQYYFIRKEADEIFGSNMNEIDMTEYFGFEDGLMDMKEYGLESNTEIKHPDDDIPDENVPPDDISTIKSSIDDDLINDDLPF